MIQKERTINVEKTDTQANLLYLLIAQLQQMVTGNPEIEIDEQTGGAIISGTIEQHRKVQELYEMYAPRLIQGISSYFDLFVHRNNLHLFRIAS